MLNRVNMYNSFVHHFHWYFSLSLSPSPHHVHVTIDKDAAAVREQLEKDLEAARAQLEERRASEAVEHGGEQEPSEGSNGGREGQKSSTEIEVHFCSGSETNIALVQDQFSYMYMSFCLFMFVVVVENGSLVQFIMLLKSLHVYHYLYW